VWSSECSVGIVIVSCASIQTGQALTACSIPPVLSSLALTRETYEKLEKEVEKGVKESAQREREFPDIKTK
jgi:hypothetical protein